MDANQSDRDQLRKEAAQFHWYHCIEIAPGLETPGYPWTRTFVDEFRAATSAVDFRGKRVLDVGCRDGAMSFIAEAGGASEVVSIDNDLSAGLRDFLIPLKRSKIRAITGNLYDIEEMGLGAFDIVICAGLIYHLRFPIFGLKKLAATTADGGSVIIETALIDMFSDLPVLLYAEGAQSPYEASSPSFFNLAGLTGACGAVGLCDPRVLRRFNATSFETAKHFPEYARNAVKEGIAITRTISAWTRRARANALDRYFEGQHQFHSTGHDSPIDNFLDGRTSALELVAALPPPIDTAGLHEAETYGDSVLRWTDGSARIRWPLGNPERRVHGLRLALWPMRVPGSRLRLTVNGVMLFDGPLDEGEWARDFRLDELPASDNLEIAIESDSFNPPGDPRTLGLALRQLLLTR